MTPVSALAASIALLLGLLRFDPSRDQRTSTGLWLPVAWMFFVATRLPSQWFGGAATLQSNALEDGSSSDRLVYVILIALSIYVLLLRSFNWQRFASSNRALVAFLIFALVSVAWSDFPFVAFKRWFRDLGNYLSVLVVLTDPIGAAAAIGTLIRRLSYLMIGLSLVIIKYYPAMGVQYNTWTGTAMFVGPTTSKNSLGVVCLVSGLFFFWDTLSRWRDRRKARTKYILYINLILYLATLYLLHRANSATSRACLAIGSLIIAAAGTKLFRKHPGTLQVLTLIILSLYPILLFGFDMKAQVAAAVGRDPTFTDRADIWRLLPSLQTNVLFGTGYESFWLGSRLKAIWSTNIGSINEAHNGYLELYLNLGLTGVVLLAGLLVESYKKIHSRLVTSSVLGSLSWALWAVMLLYNMTEAAFRFHFMWSIFLLVSITLPKSAADSNVYPEPDRSVGRQRDGLRSWDWAPSQAARDSVGWNVNKE